MIERKKNKLLAVLTKNRRFPLFFAILLTVCTLVGTVSPQGVFAQEAEWVYVSGQSIGIAMMSRGLIVVKAGEVKDENGKAFFPAADAGIRPGDIVTHIDGEEILSAGHLTEIMCKKTDEAVKVTYTRGDKTVTVKVKPALDADSGERKLGLIVRDSTSGIGTLTFVDGDSGNYASLGHAITEVTTGIVIPAREGTLSHCMIKGIVKGKSGQPGELRGSFSLQSPLGSVTKNNEFGVYGEFYNKKALDGMTKMQVCPRDEIKIGRASILCTLDDGGAEYYDVTINKINSQSSKGVKGLVIEVVDEDLLKKTGGIVQGMSGSPIVQDGRLVGAVTHVMINDSSKGYGIFAEWMLDEAA